MLPTGAWRGQGVRINEKAGTSSRISEATYLTGFDSGHGGIVVDNGEVVLYLLFLSESDPIHVRSLNEIIIRLLVLSDPFIVCRSLKSNRTVCRILHSAIQSIIECLDLAFEGVGVVELLVSVNVDTRLFCVGAGGSGQPAHSGLVTLLGVVKDIGVDSVIDTGGMTCMRWNSDQNAGGEKCELVTDRLGRAW